ncbi:putative inorganic carbon transporter subunit DabA [Cryobacterium sp. N21]|uniref:putative inorganic carbon transporter subunit DabA n=1 Tax=Cryobacterium sp. N21 TaxID=2048289 RepID=UPI001304BBDC|nr:putative inorganic carbon transporter subunit DabA [Cryobacterium sp. N21]
MSLILRAQIASAARNIVSGWPVESFIAVNPLAGHEANPFHTVTAAGVALTRDQHDYLEDLRKGRITDADLAQAISERIPELSSATFSVDGQTVPAVRVAVLDMTTASWGPIPTPSAPSRSTRWLDEYLAAWLPAGLTPDPLWPMPHIGDGFFGAWRRLALRDPCLPRAARRTLREAPVQADAALDWALARLAIAPELIRGTLAQELEHQPGWVGYIKWRAEKHGDIDLTSYLASRFVLRAVLTLPVAALPSPAGVADERAGLWQRAEQLTARLSERPTREAVAAIARVLAHHPITEHPFTWQKAYELHYRTTLIRSLSPATSTRGVRPTFQVVMCIDPRSEGMRRHLEITDEVETFGFAGFFGVPVRFARYSARGSINSLPALLTPRHTLTEDPTDTVHAEKYVARGRARDALRRAVHNADSSTATPFAFAETAGWLYGPTSMLRTFAPRLHRRLNRWHSVPLHSSVTIADAFTLEERAGIAETAVRMMGMTDFAPLVVLAGHSSESANNLYQSALDCGACGGNPGAANARAAATIFNDPAVRALLMLRGIDIPEDTVFVAADHNTTRDTITLLDHHLVPDTHRGLTSQFDQLHYDAGLALLNERAADLPGATRRQSPARVRARAYDWAEVYPELGLAGNAAMVIGSRTLTRGIDLGRRVFLHSYDTSLDPDGTALETIMTAPLVVAQWINHQYYFSALNPDTLGAGTKTIHNAIGTIGVIAGQAGDLRRGLPWQSVGVGTTLFHEPMRLAVIIEAPLERIGVIISRNQVLRNLFDNDWITLTARSTAHEPWHQYGAYGWKPTNSTTEGTSL